MRRGNQAKLLWNEKNELVAFSTGADYCAEHENGSSSMLSMLCRNKTAEDNAIRAMKGGSGALDKIKHMFGKDNKMPSLLATRQVTEVDKLRLVTQVIDGVPYALLTNHPSVAIESRSIAFHRNEETVVGAWDEEHFAICVRGDKELAGLVDFHAAIKNGKVHFAGSFLRRDDMHGVILAHIERLEPEDLAQVHIKQKEYESLLRLKARDDTMKLNIEMSKLSGQQSVGYIWAMWKDASESEIIYGLNPYRDNMAAYYGPYTRQDLLDWAASKYSYYLEPALRNAPSLPGS